MGSITWSMKSASPFWCRAVRHAGWCVSDDSGDFVGVGDFDGCCRFFECGSTGGVGDRILFVGGELTFEACES